MVGTIGENMTVRRSEKLSVENGVVASYIHNQVVDGLGKIGVLVALESTGDTAVSPVDSSATKTPILPSPSTT